MRKYFTMPYLKSEGKNAFVFLPEFVKKHNQDPVSFYHFERDKRTK